MEAQTGFHPLSLLHINHFTYSVQSEEVANICDYFSTQMSRATTAKKDKEAKLRNAVYGNLKLMRKTLSAEQYAKYAALMNITLQNKGIELNK